MAFDITGLGAVFDFGGKLIDKFFPNPEDKAKAQLQLMQMQQTGELAKLAAETDLAKGQLEVNKAEASSGSRWAGGWRPSVGYTCVAGLMYTFLLQPLLPWFVALLGASVPPLPALDTNVLMTLLLGMLGIGGMRSFDKKQGTS
jgi:hypothetical protein